MTHWLYPANIKFYDVLSAFEENYVYWPINSTISIDDMVIFYLTAPHKQIGYFTEVTDIDISPLDALKYIQPYMKKEGQLTPKKQFMKLKVTNRITLRLDSVLSYVNLKDNGLNGPLLGPRKLDNNPKLHSYIKQNN